MSFEVRQCALKWISLRLSLNKSMDSTFPPDQKCAIGIFTQSPYAVRFTAQRVEFWRARFPAPQAVRHTHPEITLAVLIQAEHSAAKTTIISVAMDAALVNCA